MAKWLQLWNVWEVQLLVLVSFILQVFLHITGRRRRSSKSMLLRLCIWIAYLAADSVAVYVLGILSRQVDGGASEGRGAPHPLAFIWAPFLLIHLGGQDNITAFAIEDNNLWLRHLLNLVVQCVLALYVFWKSMGTAWRDDVRLLAPGFLVFLAGLIKYGERTMALKYGNLRNLNREDSAVDDGDLSPDHAVRFSCTASRNPADPCFCPRRDIVSAALNSMARVRGIFAGCTLNQMTQRYLARHLSKRHQNKSCTDLSFKLMEIELAIMYDDLYTKAVVLRTRTCIVARCVSQVSTGVALVLFLVSSKQKYSRVDVAMTYLLFVGCLCLEVLSTHMIIISPWTWDWFKARKYSWLASMSWWLLSSKVGWPEERPLWSNYMGQYNFLSYMGEYGHHSGGWKQKLMMLVRQTVNFAGVGKGCLFPISKLLEIRFEKVEEDIKVSIAKVVQDYYSSESNQRQFTKLALLLPEIGEAFAKDFGWGIIKLHVSTEVHFGNASPQDTTEAAVRVVCRKLSNYMMYLFVRKPEMLPVVSGATEANLKDLLGDKFTDGEVGSNVLDGDFWCIVKEMWRLPELPRCKETAEEMKELWLRILLYAAGKSRPEINAAQLREGGELLTFAWLLMAHKGLGDSGSTRIELIAPSQQQGRGNYVFHLDHSQRSSAAESPV